jgi:PAS domain S-box-containing protein
VFGFKAAELRGVWLDDLAHPDDRAALLGYLYTASRQPEAADAVQWRWRDREGVWRDVETVGTNLVHMPDVAGVVLNTRDVSERKALERERAQLLDKTVQAAEEERTRLAAELHDWPIQRLTTMGYDLARAHRWLEKTDLDKGLAILESSQQQLSSEINGLRELMASLRPPVLDEVGLEAALREHIKNFSHRAGVTCSLDTAVVRRLEPEIETVLYRVTQEALTNVSKHAAAEHLWVTLQAENGSTELEIRDDGIGFASADTTTLTRNGHFGLIGMRQRVEMAGGRFSVTSRPGEGVVIRAIFVPAEGGEAPQPIPGLTTSQLHQ